MLITGNSPRRRRIRCETNNDIIKRSLRIITKQYCKESSIGGLKYLVDDDNSFFERLIWYMTMAGALICSVLLVWLTFQKYYNAPLVTTQLPEGISVDKIIFPAVGVCSINRISKKAVTALARELLREERNSKYSETEMLTILSELGQFYDLQPQSENNLKELQHVLGTYDVRDLLKRLTPRCDNILLRCLWNEEVKNCANLFDFRLTANGYCCCFNYIRFSDTNFLKISHDIYAESKNHGNKSHFDFDQGLKILLRFDEHDDFYYNLQLQGAILQFSQPYDFPDAPSGSFALQIVSRNVQMTVSITSSVTEASREIQHIPLSLRKCLFSDESSYLSYYTYSDCLLKCRMEFLAAACNCTPYNMPKTNDFRICDALDLACLRKYYAQSITIRPRDNDVPPEMEDELVSDSISCPMCYPGCSDVLYMYDFTNVKLYSDHLNSVPDENRDDWLKNVNYTDTSLVHVKYGRGLAECYGQKVIMEWFDLFSTIGSTCGFVTGFSFVSILEFVYFFTIKLAREFIDQKRLSGARSAPFRTADRPSMFPITRYRPIYWNELNTGRRIVRLPEID